MSKFVRWFNINSTASISSLLIVLSLLKTSVGLGVRCSTTLECEERLRIGSICSNGYCTNPLMKGCLHHEHEYGTFGKLKGGDTTYSGDEEKEDDSTNDNDNSINAGFQKFVQDKLRVCNSDDPPDAEARNICQKSNPFFNYTEIRIASANWDSAVFLGWIMQILLSEILGVPATIFNGKEESISFYDEFNGFEYPSVPYPWQGLARANELNGNCSEANSTEQCVHIIPEKWQPLPEEYKDSTEGGHSGLIGENGWYISQFTLDEYPSLSSYIGLRKSGERLAEIFKRPTTWKDYCEQVSLNNCSINDGVAKRPPTKYDEDEEAAYYADDNYIGHFRYTEKNNCSNPDITCTGHFIDYPCDWTSFFERLVYWNDISLENDIIYTSGSQMKQIIKASNATKSHIVLMWWYPEPTLAEDYQKVLFPPFSSQCSKARNFNADDRCTDRIEKLRGTEESNCDHPYESLRQVYAKSLVEMSMNSSDAAKKNPAYDLLFGFNLKNLDIMELLEEYMSLGKDANHYDARDIVCSWVIQNFDHGRNLSKFLPEGYPIELVNEGDSSISITPILIGSISTFAVVTAMYLTYYWRQKEVIQYAQPIFVYIFCAGNMGVSIAAIFYVLGHSSEICMLREWFELIGSAMIVAPLLVKTSTINGIRKQDRPSLTDRVRIVVSEKLLRITTISFLFICMVYLICWTAIDPSTKQENTILLEDDQSARKVMVQLSCSSSRYSFWKVYTYVGIGLCVCITFILQVQALTNKSIFDELIHMRIVVYTGLVFFVFRSIVVYAPDIFSSDPNVNDSITSIILSIDVIVNMGSYFAPKFLKMYTKRDLTELDHSFVQITKRESTKVARRSAAMSYYAEAKMLICIDCANQQ